MVTAAKPVQPIAELSRAAWFHEAAEITDVVGKPSLCCFRVCVSHHHHTIFITPELSSLMGILTSSPPAAQLNDYDLVLLPPDYVLCHQLYLPPPFSLRLTAWCHFPLGQKCLPLYHSDTIMLSRPLPKNFLIQLHCRSSSGPLPRSPSSINCEGKIPFFVPLAL